MEEVKTHLQDFGMEAQYTDALIEKAVMASLFDTNKTVEMLMTGEVSQSAMESPAPGGKSKGQDLPRSQPGGTDAAHGGNGRGGCE